MVLINFAKNIIESVNHFLFPHNCLGCNTDIISVSELLCAKCLLSLPATKFETATSNPIEKTFVGRLKIEQATASFYFSKDSLLQHLVKQLKYKNNKEVGLYLGNILGTHLLHSNRFNNIDALIPLPLNSKKEYKRGYNQAYIICQGIQQVFDKPIIKDAVIRKIFTSTQTKENRINRWQNIDGAFELINPSLIENKNILLIDDVITTGSTLESCGQEILKASNSKLSIACVAYTI